MRTIGFFSIHREYGTRKYGGMSVLEEKIKFSFPTECTDKTRVLIFFNMKKHDYIELRFLVFWRTNRMTERLVHKKSSWERFSFQKKSCFRSSIDNSQRQRLDLDDVFLHPTHQR